MIPQQAMAQRLSTGPLKRLSSMGRVVSAVLVFVAVCLTWFGLVLLFAPFILIAVVSQIVRRRGDHGSDKALDNTVVEAPQSIHAVGKGEAKSLVFDRRGDISKLYGCNTRNVRYRWRIFKDRMELLLREFEHPRALDFGAGSLRDSYELARQGFEVISFDLNDRILQRYFDSYDWTTVSEKPALMTGPIDALSRCSPENSIQLVLAFDVIEHLEDPASYVQAFHKLLGEGGFLFTIVPNKRSLFEKYFKRSLAQQRKRGVQLEPGVPHIQFKSPAEWDAFFQSNGFRIVERDMAIGHFVNDWWNGLLAVPLRTFVYPVLEVVAFYSNREIDPGRIERILCSSWLMERVNLLDTFLKRSLSSRFGWNLIVAQKTLGS
ncbi:MAG TPA: class I SAM-dependent methyltransferase [Pyrinomonadaceae bacterium]|jgi:SAM-dependent methyltransferase|nr:class I SAM-dependent methyltransferase [Pyrinomonadaceae bacterium]